MSTETFFCNMGVSTMKMIRSTSITSTMGVTLISEVTLAASFRFANDIEFCLLRALAQPRTAMTTMRKIWRRRDTGASSATHLLRSSLPLLFFAFGLGPAHAPALQEVIDQFARRVIHLHVERFHATGQVVKHHNRRECHKQTDARGSQRFGNTAGDRCQSGCAVFGHTVEGVQNADHRAEQPHEGSC